MGLSRRCLSATPRGRERRAPDIELTLDLADLRCTFAERNADRALLWLRDRLGHSGVAVTERYLRNVLNVDTGKM